MSDKKTDNIQKAGLPVFQFFLTFYDKSFEKTAIQGLLGLSKTDGDTLKNHLFIFSAHISIDGCAGIELELTPVRTVTIKQACGRVTQC